MSRRLRRQVGTAVERHRVIAATVHQTVPLLDAPKPWQPWRRRELHEVDRKPPHGATHVMENGWFAVSVRPLVDGSTHLLITNFANTPVRSWRDLQRIKNELCGEGDVGVEIFPRESEVMDQANMTHLWVGDRRDLPRAWGLQEWASDSRRAAQGLEPEHTDPVGGAF